MTNDDLKRLYGINANPEMNKDFVRYGENGEIITKHDATKNEEVVNYRTLIKHAGGAGADVNYRGAWTSGMTIKQYDIVYINTFKTRQYYMASNDITSSTIAPNIDTNNYFLYLEVERNIQRDTLPQASEEYVDDIIQYIGETNQNYINGYFYKCERAITYYIIVAEDDSITCYCAELPALGQSTTLYTDTDLTTELSGKELLHITTGYDIVNIGESMGINTTQTPNIQYTWQQLNVQPGGEAPSNVMTLDTDQTITGTKTWSSEDNDFIYENIISTTDGFIVQMTEKNNNKIYNNVVVPEAIQIATENADGSSKVVGILSDGGLFVIDDDGQGTNSISNVEIRNTGNDEQLAYLSDIPVYGCTIEVTNASGIPFLACINGRWTEYNTTISLSNCSELKINNGGGQFDETTGFVNVDFDFDHPENHVYVTNNSATVTILAGGGN